MEPSNETVDELLDDIDDVLRRINRRVIIVVDDLDRLDAKAVNNVLFAARRTFKLTQATYILCYDTEVLTAGKDDEARAREFLEKFVTVKLSLFVDSSSIQKFLRRDWQKEEHGLVPSDTMVKLGGVVTALADLLNEGQAVEYLRLLGDLRKIKRFVNAMLVMQMEKSDLGRSDFHSRDLINLMLLHLNYPGVFRRLYAEETEKRTGSFSLRQKSGSSGFENIQAFSEILESLPSPARFLLAQVFDVSVLGFGELSNPDESMLATRACFNHGSFRNLENYLKLIVRFATPEPRLSYFLYRDALDQVLDGSPIAEVLSSPHFSLQEGAHAHDRFWRLLVNRSQELGRSAVDDAITTLVAHLPRYPSIEHQDRGLRQRSAFSLLRLLDMAGWDHAQEMKKKEKSDYSVEIAWRIFGEGAYVGKGLLCLLVDEKQGVLGWNDLMVFRLYCSADRSTQLYHLRSALISRQEQKSPNDGKINGAALTGMREISQAVFALFKVRYIDSRINFLADVNKLSGDEFLGAVPAAIYEVADDYEDTKLLADRIAVARSVVRSFVIYQLANKRPPTGSGVGCGYYDQSGSGDKGGIAAAMNSYMFTVCFNPDDHKDNVLLFLDFCLSNLSSSSFREGDGDDYIPIKSEISAGLDLLAMGRYWQDHGDEIRGLAQHASDRTVATSNYIASYQDDLPGVYKVLDELAYDAIEGPPAPKEPLPQ